MSAAERGDGPVASVRPVEAVRPCALTVAGSDSGGNAGVQADLRTFHDYRVHGCTVFAALTAQTPFGVTGVHAVPADFVLAQLDAVLSTYSVRALKTGMLPDAAAIEAMAERLRARPDIAKVIDPVMVATSGARLIPPAAVRALTECLLPLATVITPNLPEARVLAGGVADERAWRDLSRGESADEAADLARTLAARFGCAVLVKGGHGVGDQVTDVLCEAATGRVTAYVLPRVPDPVSTHGTGCSLSAALAAELTLGHPLAEAVRGAKRYVHAAIENAYRVGPNGCAVLGFVDR